jgi:hypothetical protein
MMSACLSPNTLASEKCRIYFLLAQAASAVETTVSPVGDLD